MNAPNITNRKLFWAVEIMATFAMFLSERFNIPLLLPRYSNNSCVFLKIIRC